MIAAPEVQQWFDYSVRVQPCHTDYAAVVWHGSYLSWMEAARISALRDLGIEFSDLVVSGCDLPVVELSLNYHQPLKMGEVAVVKSGLSQIKKVRMSWEQHIYAMGQPKPSVTAQVTLVPVNRQTGRIIRKLPPHLLQAIEGILKPSPN
ncbi:MAG: acyl-CoA thioesterase [Thermosynechococcaceae cyanobacterium]